MSFKSSDKFDIDFGANIATKCPTALVRCEKVVRQADVVACVTFEALKGIKHAFDPGQFLYTWHYWLHKAFVLPYNMNCMPNRSTKSSPP